MSVAQWAGILVPLGSVIVGYFIYRANKGNAFIDQLQEQEKETRRRLEDLEADTKQALKEQGDVINRQADYIGVLRKHIADGAGPPPPPYPDGLRV